MKNKFNKIKKALHQEVPDWDGEIIWDQIENSLPNDQVSSKKWLLFLLFLLGLSTGFTALYFVSNRSIQNWSLSDSNMVDYHYTETQSSTNNKNNFTSDSKTKDSNERQFGAGNYNTRSKQINSVNKEDDVANSLENKPRSLSEKSSITKSSTVKPSSTELLSTAQSSATINLTSNKSTSNNSTSNNSFQNLDIYGIENLTHNNSTGNGRKSLDSEQVNKINVHSNKTSSTSQDENIFNSTDRSEFSASKFKDSTIESTKVQVKSANPEHQIIEQNLNTTIIHELYNPLNLVRYSRKLIRLDVALLDFPNNEIDLLKNNAIKINAAILYPIRKLSSDVYSNWTNTKSNHEEPLETYQIEIEYERKLTPKVSLGFGLNWQQTAEMVALRDTTSISTNVIASDSAIVVDNLFLPGELTETNYSGKEYLWPNRYQSINLPITVYYQISNLNHHWHLGVGINNRIWSQYSGYTQNLGGDLIYDTFDFRKLYKQRILLSSAHLSCEYRIQAKHWQFHIGTRVNLGLRSILVDKDVNHRYHGIGLRAGVIRTI